MRFVDPDIVRLPLSNGDWIDVKKELNAGEEQEIFTNLVKTMVAGEKPELDPKQVGITKLSQYIVGWSATKNGTPVSFSVAALRSLDQDDYAEIAKAVDAHEESVEKARAERKNVQATGSKSLATSV